MTLDDVCIVVIGRNEGRRLTECLISVKATGVRAVYVDSGSSDTSINAAQRMDVDIISLDDSCPHTAARGRNAGFEHMCSRFPKLRFVQFLDGDCIIAPGWVESAAQELRANKQVVMVCGRLRERFPERTVYNRLCDMEWNRCAGECKSCGGNCMVRASAFNSVNGFDSTMIAGEEPEFGWRLRHAGGKIRQLPKEMATHDAALDSFGRWWGRQVRAGHAAAENADRHGRMDREYYFWDVASNLAYGVLVPAAGSLIALYSWISGLIVPLAVYTRLYFRVRSYRRRLGDPSSHAALYATFTVLGKFPQALGLFIYIWRRKILKQQSELIEYKRV